MIAKRILAPGARAVVAAALALVLSGCSYDYLQRTDRVAFSAGDAVKANLEGATTDPSSDSQYDTSGLGQNGQVTDPDAQGTPTP